MLHSMPVWLAVVLLTLVIPWAWIAGRNSRRWLIMRLKDRADRARRERKKVEQELARLREDPRESVARMTAEVNRHLDQHMAEAEAAGG